MVNKIIIFWRALGGTTGGNTNGEPTDESVDSSYGQYAGIYYSQRATWMKLILD